MQVQVSDVQGDPVWGLPVPICVSRADEFDEVGTPQCEGDGEAQGGGGEVAFLNEGG